MGDMTERWAWAWVNELRASHGLKPTSGTHPGMAVLATYHELGVVDPNQTVSLTAHALEWWHVNGTFRQLKFPDSLIAVHTR